MFVLGLLKFEELLAECLDSCLLIHLQPFDLLRCFYHSMHSFLYFNSALRFLSLFLFALVGPELHKSLKMVRELLVVLETLENVVFRVEALHSTIYDAVKLRV